MLRGELIDAGAVLSQYPHLETNDEMVHELAQMEYNLRRKAGEVLNIEEFCGRFGRFKDDLERCFKAEMFAAGYLSQDQRPFVLWPQPGAKFADFTLLRELGHGGFAHVYLATEDSLDGRLVALKISKSESAEAKTLGKLTHPNIVPVHSIPKEKPDGLSAVCMPYLGNATLHDVLRYAQKGQDPGPGQRHPCCRPGRHRACDGGWEIEDRGSRIEDRGSR